MFYYIKRCAKGRKISKQLDNIFKQLATLGKELIYLSAIKLKKICKK